MYTIFAWLVTLFKPKASFAYLSIEAWQTAVVGSFPCKRKKWLFCCGGAMGRVLQTYIFPKRQVLNLTATITWNWRKSHFATLNYKQKKHRMLNFYVLTAASGFIQLKREACKKWWNRDWQRVVPSIWGWRNFKTSCTKDITWGKLKSNGPIWPVGYLKAMVDEV